MAEKKTVETETIEALDEPTEFQTEQEKIAEENELLADLPQLTDPKKLRIKHQNALKRISLAAAPVFKRAREEGDQRNEETVEAMLVMMEQIDDFAEAIAKRPDEYAEWSGGKDEEYMLAIFSRYMRALGE